MPEAWLISRNANLLGLWTWIMESDGYDAVNGWVGSTEAGA